MVGQSGAELLLGSLPREVAARITTGTEMARRLRPGAPRLLPLGSPPLDTLLSGGLTRGELLEVVGGPSSGRFSLALLALAAATSTGEAAALVDTGGQLAPREAEAAGVDLERLLWVRPPHPRAALAAAEVVVATGFPLVVLDLGPDRTRARSLSREAATWLRLSRTAGAREVALLVLAPCRLSGAAAGTLLEAARARPEWRVDRPGQVPLLSGLAAGLTLVKRRGARPGAAELLRFRPPVCLPGEAPPLPLAAGTGPAFAEPARLRARA